MELNEAKKILNILKNDMELSVSGWHGRLDRKEIEAVETALKEIKTLEKQLKIKNNYLELIYAMGFDYDGFEQVESLKDLIDELVDYAVKALKNDDSAVVAISGRGKELNILYEEIGD